MARRRGRIGGRTIYATPRHQAPQRWPIQQHTLESYILGNDARPLPLLRTDDASCPHSSSARHPQSQTKQASGPAMPCVNKSLDRGIPPGIELTANATENKESSNTTIIQMERFGITAPPPGSHNVPLLVSYLHTSHDPKCAKIKDKNSRYKQQKKEKKQQNTHPPPQPQSTPPPPTQKNVKSAPSPPARY